MKEGGRTRDSEGGIKRRGSKEVLEEGDRKEGQEEVTGKRDRKEGQEERDMTGEQEKEGRKKES